MKLQQGTQIRNFALSEKLGEGGMGEVWKATLDIVGKSIAVKFVLPELRNPQLERRFLEEARIMARLDHEGIVPLTDFFMIDDLFVLVMPYLRGRGLDRLIDSSRHGLPLAQVKKLSLEILSGLGYAHENDVIHRDIKPSNVLVTQTGKAWLMDFGIAKAVGDPRLTQTGFAIGTVNYMSPEQILYPDKIDCRADIYSFGVMLYEMLAGRRPFDDPENDSGSTFRIQTAHCTQPPPPMRQWNPSISGELEAVVLRALAKKPEDRYQTCAEFAHEIEIYDSNEVGRVKPRAIAVERPTVKIPSTAINGGAASERGTGYGIAGAPAYLRGFCPNCGAQTAGVFCPNCGAAVAIGATYPQPAQPLRRPGMSDSVAGALCYLGWIVTAIIFLVFPRYRRSKFVRFHAFQSIFLFVGWIVCSIAITILHLFFLHFLLWLVMVVLWLYMMYSAFNNNKVKIPVIGDLAEKQA